MQTNNPFTKHPKDVGMTYRQHMCFAMMLARVTLVCAVASVIHAFFPFFFTHSTSKRIFKLYDLLKNRIK